MSIESFFYPHQVTVKDAVNGAGMGDGYGTPRTIRAEVKDEQRLVRGSDGAEVVSSSQVTVPLTADVQVGALVTVWTGTPAQREAEVLAVARNENAAPLPSYLVLSLT